MRRKHFLLPALAAAVLALAGCASDHSMGMHHGSGMGAAAAAGHLSAADMGFVATAAGTDMYEIQAGQLAVNRATQPQVRNYGQMLVNHHTMSSTELKSIVSAKGAMPAAALPPDKAAKIAQLQKLQGADFDREFIRMTGVADHQVAIAQFEQASRSLADPDLRNFANKTLPVLNQHLRAAQEIAGRMAG